MNNLLTYTIVNVYGTDKMYPANAEAKIFAKLAGCITLSPRILKLAEELGYTHQEVLPVRAK